MQTKANGQAAHGKSLGAVFIGETHGDRDSRKGVRPLLTILVEPGNLAGPGTRLQRGALGLWGF